jgi:hypothetical protein
MENPETNPQKGHKEKRGSAEKIRAKAAATSPGKAGRRKANRGKISPDKASQERARSDGASQDKVSRDKARARKVSRNRVSRDKARARKASHERVSPAKDRASRGSRAKAGQKGSRVKARTVRARNLATAPEKVPTEWRVVGRTRSPEPTRKIPRSPRMQPGLPSPRRAIPTADPPPG